MTRPPNAIPLRPDFSAARNSYGTIYRAAAAYFRGYVLQQDPLNFLKDDEAASLVLRAARNPAMIGTGGWAATLAATAVFDVLVGIGGPSAGAELVRLALRTEFGGQASISVPARVIDPDDAGGFIAEGDPIPVRTMPLTASTLTPARLACIVTLSDLLAQSSNAERVITQMLGEAARLRFDTELFSTTAGSTSRPAGLLSGVTPITATAAGSEAMEKDIAALVGALNAAGGGTNPVFVCSPAQAATLKLRAGARFDYPILSSAALPNGSIATIEVGSFVSAFDPIPEFHVSNHTALHMEADTPAPLAQGTGATVASPTRSLYQTVTSALKMILQVSWAMRATGHVQVINSCNW
jgi:hypothetical protein